MNQIVSICLLLLIITTAAYGSINSRPSIDYATPMTMTSFVTDSEPPEIGMDDRFMKLQDPASKTNVYELVAVVLLFLAYFVVIIRQLF